jgi:hypothetical protein
VGPLLLVLAAALIAGAVIGAAVSGRHARRSRILPIGAPVIVVTTAPDDRSFHGVVGHDDGSVVVLCATHLLAAGRDPLPIGDVRLDHDRISFVQTGVAPVDVLAAPERPRAIPLPDTSRPARLRTAPAAPVDSAEA